VLETRLVTLPALVALVIRAVISWCGFSIANGNAAPNVFVAFVALPTLAALMAAFSLVGLVTLLAFVIPIISFL